ncbi:MAG: LPXTG cell wall anchor domain-containing protein [Lachnospiraceae bacterium]|nr:LPXTG cell wall anchor domain-containing protein [Lachnospiraceae bacterium]
MTAPDDSNNSGTTAPSTPSNPGATTPSTPSTPSTPATPSAPAQADVKDAVPDTGETFPMGIAVFGGLALVSGMVLVVSYGRKKSACR